MGASRDSRAQGEPAPAPTAPDPAAPGAAAPDPAAPDPAASDPGASPAPQLTAPDVGATPATKPVRLKYNLPIDVSVTGAMAAALIVWGVAVKPNLDAPSCVICDGSNGKVNGVDDFFRRSLKQGESSPAGIISDVLAYGVAPASGIALAIATPLYDRRGDEVAVNSLLIVEASLAFAVLQQGLTALVPRERPAVHAAQGAERESGLQRHSSFESFPAGHNGAAFAIAAAGGTIATMRGYRLAPLVWITGGMIAVATSYLRIAADRHYFTDVMTGAALGIGTGIAIPLLFHPRVNDEQPSAATRWLKGAMLSTTEIPGGRMIGIGWSM
jgi:membrane-associated phospholipid phosphatase